MTEELKKIMDELKDSGIEVKVEEETTPESKEMMEFAKENYAAGYRAGYRAAKDKYSWDTHLHRAEERERKLEELKNRKPFCERVLNKLGYEKSSNTEEVNNKTEG